MNKMLTLGLAGLLSASLVSAEETVTETDAAAETVVNNFDGLYLGVGIGGSFLKNKGFSGKAYKTSADAIAADGTKLVNVKDSYNSNRFAGHIFAGYRKVFANNFALGAEALVEIARNQKRDLEWDGSKVAYETVTNQGQANTSKAYAIHIENKAITPELALTVGYATPCAYFGLRVVAARPEAKGYYYKGDDAEHLKEIDTKKAVKIVPAVYAEAARAFGKWIVNVQAGYQFGQKYDNMKFNQGWKIRAGVARSFNLF